jgi:hypothetical protein
VLCTVVPIERFTSNEAGNETCNTLSRAVQKVSSYEIIMMRFYVVLAGRGT